jgi:2'-5' RNA ligase superfamily protein
VPVHLTLFAQLPPSIERELAQRLSAYAAAGAPQARLAGVMDLGTGTAFRVESLELEDIRDDLALALHGLLSAQDRAPWAPHVTIQNKVEPREARVLQASLRLSFQVRPLAIKGLASWRYREGPWEAIRSFAFRG